MMLLELNDVMKIIGDQCVKLMMWTDKVSEGGDESVKKGAGEMKTIINAYTGLIRRAIEKAENERVCSMLEGMEKYEFKTDEEGANDRDHHHTDGRLRRARVRVPQPLHGLGDMARVQRLQGSPDDVVLRDPRRPRAASFRQSRRDKGSCEGGEGR